MKTPSSHDLELISKLHADLTEAEFTNDGVAELLGTDAVTALDREQVVPGQLVVEAELPPASTGVSSRRQRCAVLTALWLVSVRVTPDQVESALPRTGLQGLEDLELVETREGVVRPLSDLRPYQVETTGGQQNLWVTSDLAAHEVQGALPHEHVLGIGQASLTLAGITHRAPVGTALDLGTGCGIQLLHLLDHAEHVVGTDISARALDFARFNLLLNAEALRLDAQNLEARVELLQGSLFEPVAGRQFDLVVSNPPFVITPRTEGETEADRYIYRDGGREGDALMQELISALPRVLTPGGTAQMLGNWEMHRAGEDTTWDTRPRQWVEGTGLDAWFIQRDVQTPAQYAETWLRDASEERSIAEYRRRYAHYLRDFASRGVEQIGFGMIWLGKPQAHVMGEGEPVRWVRCEELTGEIQQPLGPVIGETVRRRGDHTVLNRALTVPESVTEERYQRFGAEHPEVIIARQGAGFRRARPISSSAAGFLSAADGEFNAGQLITAVCSLTDADEDNLTQEVLDLYIEGYLAD
ncbi:methyltransferase [Nesterenkonia sp. MY13]|uniref:Methyltransferase n=1 Tax=Nesterenkonia sedimenti TaxID=1463632 RepID=A0A7X8TJG1_9MICC|nr:methyltransferase [Nesterenkonia sedimenti]NLS09694.1 methyltransferase [Nesterenkonia sedimenti]